MTIRSRVYEEHQRKLEEEQGIERRNKIGTGDRAEKSVLIIIRRIV